jgi:hypothetical protein
MTTSNFWRLFLFFTLTSLLFLPACIPAPLTNMPHPTFLPQPADVGTPTGNSPMSGDWSASTDFGKLAFTVDPDGGLVTTMYLKEDNLSCNGETFTGETQSENHIPPWTITNGEFSVDISLGSGNDSWIDVYGTYDSTANKFTGKWKMTVYGGNCEGTWETAPRK